MILILLQIIALSGSVNPNNVIFNASPDHNEVSNTTPIVLSYELDYAKNGVVFYREDIGKPIPDSKKQITIAISQQAKSQMTRNTDYTVIVVTKGPGGSTSGQPSNSFKFTKL